MKKDNKYELAVFEDNDNANLVEYSKQMQESIEKALDKNKGEKGDKGDTGKVENRRLKLEGKSNQSVRSGKNLLKGLSTPTTDTDYWDSTTKTYFTPLKDGWGKFEYDNTSGTSNVFINASPKISSTNIKPNTQYTIVTEIRNGNISENSQAFFAPTTNNANSSSATNAIIDYININNGGIFKNLITTKTSFDNVLLAFQTYLRLPANTKGSLEVRMSLYEGNYDITNFEYEEYGASPSPEYLSKIRNVGDNINLANVSDFTLSASTNTYAGALDYVDLIAGETYIISYNVDTLISTSTRNTPRLYDKTNKVEYLQNISTNFNNTIGRKIWIFNCTATGSYQVDYWANNCSAEVKISKYKIERVLGKNLTATPWTPYNCGSIDYKVENVNKTESKAIHFPLSEGQVLHEGDYIDSVEIHQNRKTVIFDGTESWELQWDNTSYDGFRVSIDDILIITDLDKKTKLLSNYFKAYSQSDLANLNENGICQRINQKQIIIKTDKANSVATWKTYLAEQYANGTPVTVEYELAEELITPLTEKQIEAHYELQKAKYVDEMTLTCLNEIETELVDIDIKLEESLLDAEKSITEIKESKSIISATILKNQSNISTYKIESTDLINVTLDSPIVVGQKLKFENGKIVIGDNVKHIKVSAQVYFFDVLTSGKKSFQCLKNGETAVQSSQNVDVAYSGFGFSENILEVSKGDVISLGIKAAVNDTIYCNRNSTWITVEVID